MTSEIVNTHTLFHHYIRELKNAEETLSQTSKYLEAGKPHNLLDYIKKLKKLQESGQDQSEKIKTAENNFKSYSERAAIAQDIVNNHPKKIAMLTESNDIFLAPIERRNECLYILDQDTCHACNDLEDSDATVLFSGKTDIKLDHEKQTDAVRVRNHNVVVSDLCITDHRHYNDAHRDAIQLIPPALHKEINGVSRRIGDQLAGTVLNNVCIEGCTIEAPYGPLQGIFASDGMHRNLKILNNDIKTRGSHTISIAGLLTGGVISGNTLRQVKGGEIPKIRLYPARVGGNMAEDGVVTILSFAHEKGCESVSYDSVAQDGNENILILDDGTKQSLDITDLRNEIPKDIEHMSLGLHDFSYNAYLDEFSTTTYAEYINNDPIGARELKRWLKQRSEEYMNGRGTNHALGQPSGEQKHIAEHDLIPALDILQTDALNDVYISEIRQTAIRSFIMKRIAIKHGSVAPFKDLGAKNERRDLTLCFLLAEK